MCAHHVARARRVPGLHATLPCIGSPPASALTWTAASIGLERQAGARDTHGSKNISATTRTGKRLDRVRTGHGETAPPDCSMVAPAAHLG
eukprot:1181904-Prorocentrum_minimum.AAC.2